LNLLYSASVLLRARMAQFQGIVLPPGVPDPRPKTWADLESLLGPLHGSPSPVGTAVAHAGA
jgi:hypothetical protein